MLTTSRSASGKTGPLSVRSKTSVERTRDSFSQSDGLLTSDCPVYGGSRLLEIIWPRSMHHRLKHFGVLRKKSIDNKSERKTLQRKVSNCGKKVVVDWCLFISYLVRREERRQGKNAIRAGWTRRVIVLYFEIISYLIEEERIQEKYAIRAR